MESVRIKQNSEALYHAARLLKDLNEQVVYVGGRIVGLLITDIIEDDVRPTFDPGFPYTHNEDGGLNPRLA
jgi:hypothetical protein